MNRPLWLRSRAFRDLNRWRDEHGRLHFAWWEISRYVNEGDVFPWGHGVSHRDFLHGRIVTYPVPLNRIVRVLRMVFFWLRSPSGVTPRERAEIQAWLERTGQNDRKEAAEVERGLREEVRLLRSEIRDNRKIVEVQARLLQEHRAAVGAPENMAVADAIAALIKQRDGLMELADNLTAELRAGLEPLFPEPAAAALGDPRPYAPLPGPTPEWVAPQGEQRVRLEEIFGRTATDDERARMEDSEA